MMKIKLPQLPRSVDRNQPNQEYIEQMQAYAKTAVEADRVDRVSNLLEALAFLVSENAQLKAKLQEKYNNEHWTKVPFVVGQVYETRGGSRVLVQSITNQPGYETVEGNDHIHRYARPHDQGRTTGTDGTCEHDLMPYYRRNDNAV